MYKSNTTDFILSPITDILVAATESLSPISHGMGGYQLAEWFMPTVFLSMTGAQEQKLKFIYWDLGSIDLENRNQQYLGSIGGMSCYDDKNRLCNKLITFLGQNKRGFNPDADIDRLSLKSSAIKEMEVICGQSLLREWYADSYKDYQEALPFFKEDQIYSQKNLLKDAMKTAYDAMYNHRNRCAHNNSVYQTNLPRFDELSKGSVVYENYFVRFFLLILLDKFFIQLYKWSIELIDY